MTQQPISAPTIAVEFTDLFGQKISVGDTVVYSGKTYGTGKRLVVGTVKAIGQRQDYNGPVFRVTVQPTHVTHGEFNHYNPTTISRWDCLIKVTQEVAA